MDINPKAKVKVKDYKMCRWGSSAPKTCPRGLHRWLAYRLDLNNKQGRLFLTSAEPGGGQGPYSKNHVGWVTMHRNMDNLTYTYYILNPGHTWMILVWRPLWETVWTCLLLAWLVKSGSSQVCSLYGGQPLTPDSGFLSSVSTLESGVGLASCPWLIDASPGQRINVTLYSFLGHRAGGGGSRGSRPNYDNDSCRQRGWSIVVREYNATVCHLEC